MKRQRKVSSIRLRLFLCGVILVTSGCHAGIREYTLQASPSPRIALRVGLYMSPAFRAYRDNLVGELGDGMRRGAEQAARQAFEEVVIIDSLSSAEIPRRAIKAIVSPEIVKVGAVAWGVPGWLTYEITCTWTIWSADGKVVYMNTFTGTGTGRAFVASTRVSTAMTFAAKDQYNKFLAHVASNRWWEGIK
jgi:hypothetical protein